MAEKAASNSNDFEEQCLKAAKAIEEADVLVLFTGAGFSADSGLAVYADVAKIPAYQDLGLEYRDLSQPRCLREDPELFYGFWGQCFNDYRNTQPHEGYNTIREWRDRIVAKEEGRVGSAMNEIFQDKLRMQQPFDREYDDVGNPCNSVFEKQEYARDANAFYCFTSNVDAHSYDVFQAGEIYECHGNIEVWQCGENAGFCPSSSLWRAPTTDNYRFFVDPTTMRASKEGGEPAAAEEDLEKDDNTSTPRIGQTMGQQRMNPLCNLPAAKNKGWSKEEDSTATTNSNWPQCPDCGRNARPAICMFQDCRWRPDTFHKKRWKLWEESLLQLCTNEALKVGILEIGCGLNVPTCRYGAEDLVKRLAQANGAPTLVRINPDHRTCRDPGVAPRTIAIESKGLEAICEIKKHL